MIKPVTQEPTVLILLYEIGYHEQGYKSINFLTCISDHGSYPLIAFLMHFRISCRMINVVTINCHFCGSRKIQRLIRVSLSTEFFSKRRKNYTFWRETRADYWEEGGKFKMIISRNGYGARKDCPRSAWHRFGSLISMRETLCLEEKCLLSTRHNWF